MRLNKEKILSGLLCASMLLSNTTFAFADTTEEHTVTTDSIEQTEVIYNKSASYFVTIPKSITLDSTKVSKYSVKVDGDIPSDKEVYVSPIDSILGTDDFDFYMKDQSTSNPKDDVIATVTQSKFYWNFEDAANALEVTDNEISATDLTAGEWKGTFDFEINMKSIKPITVTAIDESGTDLNASATNIEGEEKEELLNLLVEQGHISDVKEVDAIINVNSDTFENIATTTFDVSGLYEDGDTVSIFHYNKETSEWEYIGTDVVENGQIEGKFTSFSPVAFVQIITDEHTCSYYETVTKEPTCIEDGVKSLICKCGDSKTEIITKLGHSYTDTVIDPTHTEQGYTLHSCTRCEYSYKDTYVDAIEHVYTETITTEATCTTDGVKTFTCECGASYTEVINALGHNYDTEFTVDKEPTCTSVGSKSQHCSRCEDKTNVTEVSALGHSYEDTVTTLPTCTTTGVRTYECTKCDYSYTETIEKLAHAYEDTVINPTCTEQGYTLHSCIGCSYSYKDTYVDAIEHTYTSKVTKEATCTTDGVKTFTCECGASYTETITKLGHNPVNGYCTICNEQIAGLYDANGAMLCTWEESGIDVESNYTLSSSNTASPYYVLTNTYPATTQVVLPEGVTSIGNYAFGNCSSLTSITIPEGVTSIGNYAFRYCKNLTNIEIPNTITEIGIYAFANCQSLVNIDIPTSLTTIKQSTFDNCTSLNNIVIPNNITTIANFAFSGCSSLTSITIPSSVTSIGNGILSNCSKLTSITVETGNPIYDSRNNCNAIIETSTNKLIQGCKNTVIPNGVVSLESSSFSGQTDLTSITIPSSVTNISGYAFTNCYNLTNVTFEDTTTWSTYDWMYSEEVTFNSSELANPTTAASYLKYEYYSDWTKQ